jgi:hypothetical protein
MYTSSLLFIKRKHVCAEIVPKGHLRKERITFKNQATRKYSSKQKRIERLSRAYVWIGLLGLHYIMWCVASFAWRNTEHIPVTAADDMACLRTVLMIKIAPFVSLLALYMLLPM